MAALSGLPSRARLCLRGSREVPDPQLTFSEDFRDEGLEEPILKSTLSRAIKGRRSETSLSHFCRGMMLQSPQQWRKRIQNRSISIETSLPFQRLEFLIQSGLSREKGALAAQQPLPCA